MQIGSMGHELTKQNITLFAEGVIPKIRHLWADEGWEHRWWPSGARQDAGATPGASIDLREPAPATTSAGAR